MELLTNALDLWIFARAEAEPTYLLLRASQEKAERFFGGGRFWQIPGTPKRSGPPSTSIRSSTAASALCS